VATIEALDERAVTFSIRRLAEEFGMARETVSKRLNDSGVRPAGTRGGFPVYRLRDACPAILATCLTEDGGVDPGKMRPADRRAWFQSENERLKFEQDTAQLILAAEVQSEMATLAKIVVRELETLPDVAERDLRCGPEVIEFLQRKIRDLRARIADRLSADEGEDVRVSA
jgi:hypothetical protein